MKQLFFVLVVPLLAFAFIFGTIDEKKYPQNYFRSPVNHSIRLAGTFGELRPNHFHSGIDVKSSNGKTGNPVFAPADGYLARVKVQVGGFGKALYIRHPNGYTTVYAHLKQFTPEVEAYVKKAQYRRQSFTVDLFPEVNLFSFKKNDQIAVMGNTGSSQGPHLHFEIRNSRTEKPINPLLFGFQMADHRAPQMYQLKVYYLNEKGETLQTKIYNLSHAGGHYRIEGDTLTLGAWRVGFALKAYDHHDNVSNLNGIYSLKMLQDDSLVYDFDFESFSFGETRYINAHCDYEERVTKKSYFNRCYSLPGNKLSIYGKKVNQGIIKLYKSRADKISMIAADANGNSSELEFWIKRGEVVQSIRPPYNYFLSYKEENVIDKPSLYLHFPKGAFYENLYMKYESILENTSEYYSEIHRVHDFKTPVQKYFDIGIVPTVYIPEEKKKKAFVGYCDTNGTLISYGGRWKEGKLFAKSRALGDYCILIDDVRPTIQPIIFQKNMKGFSKMAFKISDNFPTAGKAKSPTYKATVDDHWILMEFDGKKDLLTHRFDERIGPGEHHLKLVVTDDRGNRRVFERTFLR